MEIKVNQVYKNRMTGYFIKIKEITHYNMNLIEDKLSDSEKQRMIANIVYSGECQCWEDTNTTCIRGIIGLVNFLHKYSEIKQDDMGKTFKVKLVKFDELRIDDYILYSGYKVKISRLSYKGMRIEFEEGKYKYIDKFSAYYKVIE